MDNIAEKLNLVIDYIENHLTGTIDQEQIAQIACCSYYDVTRMFSLIANINISDYIRKRRLTLAGVDLKHGKEKVIDVALKYGYDSSVSFARAFQTFHGVNPGMVNKRNVALKKFPRLVYQISVYEVLDMMNKNTIVMAGKEYEASYLGEQDMSQWSTYATKREFWRLEKAYDDVVNKPMLGQVLPYNNYPPVHIEVGQVFVVDYYKPDGRVDRKYYIADGTVWKDMPCTREFILDFLEPIRRDKIIVRGKEFEASYFGEQDISDWSTYADKREFWRLENVGDSFTDKEMGDEVLPYNNYPPIKIENGQIFVIDYHTKDGRVDRTYHIADGTIWQDMVCTRRFLINE